MHLDRAATRATGGCNWHSSRWFRSGSSASERRAKNPHISFLKNGERRTVALCNFTTETRENRGLKNKHFLLPYPQSDPRAHTSSEHFLLIHFVQVPRKRYKGSIALRGGTLTRVHCKRGLRSGRLSAPMHVFVSCNTPLGKR